MARVSNSAPEDVTLDSAVKALTASLRKKLGNTDKKKADLYLDAIKKAAEFCKSQFIGEFGRFGGQFTSHGPDHAGRVLDYAQQIAARMKPSLSAVELFTLGIASILHDVGMTAPLPVEGAAGLTDEDARWKARRERHGEATADVLRTCSGNELPAIKQANEKIYSQFLPHICAAHCTSGFEYHIFEIRRLTSERSMEERIALLAGILLIADELDITCARARPDRSRYHEFRTAITKAHWWKHWLVEGLSIDGGVIRIYYLSNHHRVNVNEFAEWTKGKLNQQLRMLRRCLDPDHDNPVFQLDISMCPVEEVWWRGDLPSFSSDVWEAAQQARLAIPGQRGGLVINPIRLFETVTDPHSMGSPSEFFRKAIGLRIELFRGQGEHQKLERVSALYVEIAENMRLMQHAVDEWLTAVRGQCTGVKLKLFQGAIGVGKTHFLGRFLHRIACDHSPLLRSVILARAELTDRRRSSVLDAQQKVALSIFNDLDQRLNIAKEIRSLMLSEYSPSVPPPVPSSSEEILSWTDAQVDTFIRAIGSICRPESEFHKKLGGAAPSALCIFLDNSDQLESQVLADLYTWAYGISGASSALLWMFLRPETYAILQETYSIAPIGLRGPEPILAPTLREVVAKRMEYYPKLFTSDERITIPVANMTYTVTDAHAALSYIVDMACGTADDMLEKLTQRPSEVGQTVPPNLRAGLQALLGILGSHVISDQEYVHALLLRRAIRDEANSNRHRALALEKWPKVLEALIIGRRNWYSSQHGAIENVLSPPDVKEHSDYFLLLHCLQALIRTPGGSEIGDLCTQLQRIGYDHARVHSGILRLSSRDEFPRNGWRDDDPLVNRCFPLVVVHAHCDGAILRDDMLVQVTPWGKYHLDTLIYQLQYWKHTFYQIVLPSSIAQGLDAKVIRRSSTELGQHLGAVFSYLLPIETRWLYGYTDDDLNRIGVYPVMALVRDKVLSQLQR